MKISQSLVSQIIDSSPFPIWVLHSDSKTIKEINPAVTSIYGYNRKDLETLPSDSIFNKDGIEINQEFFFKTKLGESLNIDLEIEIDEKTSQTIVFCKVKKEKEKGIQFGKFSTLAQNILNIGFWEVDIIQNKLFWSDRVYELHEINSENYEPKVETAIEFYREDYRDLISEKVTRLIETGEEFEVEAIIITKNLNERWVRSSGTAQLVEGKRTKIYGSIVDISELKESEQRFEALANNLPGVAFQYYLYPDGREELKNVSEGSERVLGFGREEASKNIKEIWCRTAEGGDISMLKESIQKSIETKKVWSYTWRYSHPNGKFKMLRSYGSPTVFSNGTLMFNSLIIEVTDQIRNKELLEQATSSAKIGSWEYDLAINRKGQLYCSDQTKKILGMSSDCDPTHEKFNNLMKPKEAAVFQEAIMNLIKNGKEIEQEFVIQNPEQGEKWIRLTAKGEHIQDKCIKIYGSIQDITKVKVTELQFKDVLASISDVFFALDKDLKFVYYNQAAERTFNKSRKKAIGKDFWEVFPYFKGTLINEKFDQVITSGVSQHFEYLFPLNSQWYEVSVYSFNKGVSVFFRSIQKRMEVLGELKASVDEKNAIMDSIGDAFLTLDIDWNITYWNAKAEEFTGHSRKAVLGAYFWDVFKSDINTDFYNKFNLAMSTKKDVFFEDFSKDRNKWYDLRIYASENGLSAYISDITEKKLINLNLEEASSLFEKVTQATDEAVWEWHFGDSNVRLSKNYTKNFGSQRTPFLIEPRAWKNYIHPEDYLNLSDSAKEILDNKEVDRWELDYRILNSKKEIKYLLERGVITRDLSGKPTEIVGAITDISNQKKLESQLLELNESLQDYAKKLERSNTELEHYAFVTSHDLQEPLRMITSFLDLLMKKYGDQLDSRARKYIHYANEAAKRLKQIIIDLLHYSRVANSNEPKQEVDLNLIIEDFKSLRSQVINETSASIVSDTLPTIHSYKAILAQIFHAILDNAIKYRKHGFPPLIDIHYHEKDKDHLFYIKDNGIGIGKQYFDKIFLLFQRLHNKDEYSGTGIGLTYVKRGLDFLGGTIWLDSEEEKGTTFYFTIPK